MYLVAEDPYSGSLVKLAGEVSSEPADGADRHDIQEHPGRAI